MPIHIYDFVPIPSKFIIQYMKFISLFFSLFPSVSDEHKYYFFNFRPEQEAGPVSSLCYSLSSLWETKKEEYQLGQEQE